MLLEHPEIPKTQSQQQLFSINGEEVKVRYTNFEPFFFFFVQSELTQLATLASSQVLYAADRLPLSAGDRDARNSSCRFALFFFPSPSCGLYLSPAGVESAAGKQQLSSRSHL